MLDDGIYGLSYRSQIGVHAEYGAGLAVLRDGQILGSDQWGGMFKGHCSYDAERDVSVVSIRLEVPPNGMLLTGLEAGPQGARVDISCGFAKPAPTSSVTLEIGGQPLAVELSYIGPLPG